MMDEEKRGRMAINAKELPDDVYKILNEKACKRALTPFIIELVHQKENIKLILDKLEIIEEKINEITLSKITTPKDTMEEEILEGFVVEKIKEVVGSIDREDKADYDF
jgi:hypothetical protein